MKGNPLQVVSGCHGTLTIAREENGAPEEAAAILYQAESGWTQTRETVPNTGT